MTHPERVARGTHLDDLTHEFVAEDVAIFHARNGVIVEMQIGSADRRRRDANDGVARIEDLRVRHGFDADIVLALPGERPHGKLSTGLDVEISPVSMRVA